MFSSRILFLALVILLLVMLPLVPCQALETAGTSVPAEQLGLTPVLVRGDLSCVEAAVGSDGAVSLLPLCPGENVLTVCNEYSESAEIAISIADDLTLTYTVHPFEKPAAWANVLDFGAAGDGGMDDTWSIQRAIDSLPEGGTVYIPAGVYSISYLVLREGVHLRLAGALPDAAVGYTDEVAAWTRSGEMAVLRTNNGSNHMFYNLDVGGYCTEGASNIALSGGMIDCRSSKMAFVLACADGVVLENCIIRDIPNNHAIQIDGCSNVTIRNVMFAGYLYSGINTRETIQIEPTSIGAITSNYASSPVKCQDGDLHYNSNIVIADCYFGKSDKNGPQLTPVGHHSSGVEATCDGFTFTGNVVDNPLLYGLHLINFVNVTIEDNTFISDGQAEALAKDSALICLTTDAQEITYTSATGVAVTAGCINEQEADSRIDIRNNRFLLRGGTAVRVLHAAGSTYTPGAAMYKYLNRAESFGAEPVPFEGYILNRNYIKDLYFGQNEIIVTGDTAYQDYLMYASNVYDFVCQDNTLVSDVMYAQKDKVGQEEVVGLKVSGLKYKDSVTYVINALRSSACFVYMTNEHGDDVVFPCLMDGMLRVKNSEGGQISLTPLEDGSLRITAAPEPGYTFAGWTYSNGKAVDLAAGFDDMVTVIANFAAAE